MQICQNGPLEKLVRFFMRFSVSCIAMYSVIKIYVVQIYATVA